MFLSIKRLSLQWERCFSTHSTSSDVQIITYCIILPKIYCRCILTGWHNICIATANFPGPKTALSGVLKQFITHVHTLFSMYYHIKHRLHVWVLSCWLHDWFLHYISYFTWWMILFIDIYIYKNIKSILFLWGKMSMLSNDMVASVLKYFLMTCFVRVYRIDKSYSKYIISYSS